VTTRVQNIRRIDPNEWQHFDENVYVGRYAYLRSGRFEGSEWRNSGLGNPFRFLETDSNADKRMRLVTYLRWLNLQLEAHGLLRNTFRQLRDKNLGCWCLDWDGKGPVPLCHAAYLARVVDLFAVSEVQAVCVSNFGEFLIRTGHDNSLPSGREWAFINRVQP